MKAYFYAFADLVKSRLKAGEEFTAFFEAESSDFCRFNIGEIRQSGHVNQMLVTFQLIKNNRSMSAELVLSGSKQIDADQLNPLLERMRSSLDHLPEDPYLLISREVKNTERVAKNALPDAREKIQAILLEGSGHDMVGIYASGGIYRGFANSLGQRNWYETYSFNFDWSLYHGTDKAVKLNYAGFNWDDEIFNEKMNEGFTYLELVQQKPKTISPGAYRVYLAPSALGEVMDLLGWSSFGLKSLRSKQSPLSRMLEQNTALNPMVSIRENIFEGVAADFDANGFVRPKDVDLIRNGKMVGQLVSARSAKEFQAAPTGATADESPESIEVSGGSLAQSDIFEKLDTGVYINNLWYLNFSDRNACRMTGMTRFACFWVEKGKIVAPLNVMRFDDSFYSMFGSSLIDLTTERSFLLGSSSYWQRSTNSSRLPGALLKELHFTL